ncbi:hypothetical protein F441_19773 [Phytophthora nicotianae CJ01A1]|nr:hypothetical protein F441_19773 [Phytophthora nicotianae CJ01A1]
MFERLFERSLKTDPVFDLTPTEPTGFGSEATGYSQARSMPPACESTRRNIGPRRRLRRRRRVRFPNRSSSRGNANGRNTKANLTAEGLVFVGLTYCENECSVQSVTAQIPVVIEQIRSIVKNDSRFGYHFVDGWTIER